MMIESASDDWQGHEKKEVVRINKFQFKPHITVEKREEVFGALKALGEAAHKDVPGLQKYEVGRDGDHVTQAYLFANDAAYQSYRALPEHAEVVRLVIDTMEEPTLEQFALREF